MATCLGITIFATSTLHNPTIMTPLFFLFDISPAAAFLIVAFWVVVFLVLGGKGAGRKGYQRKHQHDWTSKDWQDNLRDVQKRLDEIDRK